jgi:hypothetical protein
MPLLPRDFANENPRWSRLPRSLYRYQATLQDVEILLFREETANRIDLAA